MGLLARCDILNYPKYDLKKNFISPFYIWGSTASRLEPLRGGNSWYSFDRPPKDERLSQPWYHPLVLKTGPLNWESSALTTIPLSQIYLRYVARRDNTAKKKLPNKH